MAKASYAKLWRLLEDKDLKKMDLCEKARISTNALAKLGKNDDVRVNILVKICTFLDCTFDDIVEVVDREKMIAKLVESGFVAYPTVVTTDMGLQFECVCKEGIKTGLGLFSEWPVENRNGFWYFTNSEGKVRECQSKDAAYKLFEDEYAQNLELTKWRYIDDETIEEVFGRVFK